MHGMANFNDSYCYRIYPTFTTGLCFNNDYDRIKAASTLEIVHGAGKIELQECTNRYTGHSNITEIMFKDPLTHYHTMPHFDTLNNIALENIVKKGEIACNKQFLLFQLFSTLYGSCFFISNALLNVVCNLFQFGPV